MAKKQKYTKVIEKEIAAVKANEATREQIVAAMPTVVVLPEGGSLRQKVKKGQVSAAKALNWIQAQEHVNQNVVDWLRNRL